MNHPLQPFIDSLQIRFLHIKSYKLGCEWRILNRELQTNVLWYVIDGRLKVSINENEYVIQQGELVYLPEFGILSSRAITSNIKVVSLNFAATVTIIPNRHWCELLRFPIYWGTAGPEIQTLVQELVSISEQSTAARSILLHGSLIRLIGLMMNRYIPIQKDDSIQSGDLRVSNIITYLMGNLSLMPSVTELAEFVRLSESHLRKLFIQHVGLPPQQYIIQFKIEQAKKMLIDSSEHISVIANQLGFQDPNYFTRIFKKNVAISPREYRSYNQFLLSKL